MKGNLSAMYFSVFSIFTGVSKRENSCQSQHPASIYLFKVNNRNTRKRREKRSKLPIKRPYRSGVFIVNFEQFHFFF